MSQKGFCGRKIIITLAAVLLLVSASSGIGVANITEGVGLPNPLKVFVGKTFSYDISKHFSDSTGNTLSYNNLSFLDPDPTVTNTDWMKSLTLSSAGLLSGSAPTATDAEIQDYVISFKVNDSTGKSVGYSMWIKVSGEPNIAVTPLFVIESSPVYIGEFLKKTFTVSNTGVQNLVVGTISLSGDNASEFTIQNDGCSNKTFTPGQTATFDAVFTPTSVGSKTARVTIASNDPDTPQLLVSLNLSAAIREPNISVMPLVVIDSSSVFVGESSKKTFTVSNTGVKELAVGTIVISGDNASEFRIQNDGCSNKSINPGQSATFDAVFFPTSAGNKTAKITVPSNDPDSPQIVLSLSMNSAIKLTPPPAPVLSVAIQGKKLITSWGSAGNVSGYKFYYGATADTASMIAIDAGMLTSFSPELYEGAAFYLAIKAYNSAGESGFSNIEFFRILITPVLTVTTSGSTVTASWTAIPGATGYTLFYAPYPNAEFIKSADMGNQTGFSLALPNTAFYIAVQAYDNKSTSGYSNIGHFSTK
jgi:hypothetical protein